MSEFLTVDSTFEFDGYQIPFELRVLDSDKGLPVLFLGGAFQSRSAWNGWLKTFNNSSSLLADLPGMIDGDFLPAEVTFVWIADCIAALLDRLEIPKIDIVAISYSTPLSVCFASRYPGRTNRLVLGGTVESFDEDYALLISNTMDWLEKGRDKMFRMLSMAAFLNSDPACPVERQERINRIVFRNLKSLTSGQTRRFIANSRRVVSMHDYLPDMRRPSCATLGFTGEHDLFTPPEAMASFIGSFGGPKEFFMIPRADHLFFLERSQLTQQLCHAWLSGQAFRTESTDRGLPMLVVSEDNSLVPVG